jgi:hypothetical protein
MRECTKLYPKLPRKKFCPAQPELCRSENVCTDVAEGDARGCVMPEAGEA